MAHMAWSQLAKTLQGGFENTCHKATYPADGNDMEALCGVKRCGKLNGVKAGRLLTVMREKDPSGEFSDHLGRPRQVPKDVWLAYLCKEWCRWCATELANHFLEIHSILAQKELDKALAYIEKEEAEAYTPQEAWNAVMKGVPFIAKLHDSLRKLAERTDHEHSNTSLGVWITRLECARRIYAVWGNQIAGKERVEILEQMSIEEATQQLGSLREAGGERTEMPDTPPTHPKDAKGSKGAEPKDAKGPKRAEPKDTKGSKRAEPKDAKRSKGAKEPSKGKTKALGNK